MYSDFPQSIGLGTLSVSTKDNRWWLVWLLLYQRADNRACSHWNYFPMYWYFPMMLIQHSVNSDWLFTTQSRVLQAGWLILKYTKKATLNINMPYKGVICLQGCAVNFPQLQNKLQISVLGLVQYCGVEFFKARLAILMMKMLSFRAFWIENTPWEVPPVKISRQLLITGAYWRS